MKTFEHPERGTRKWYRRREKLARYTRELNELAPIVRALKASDTHELRDIAQDQDTLERLLEANDALAWVWKTRYDTPQSTEWQANSPQSNVERYYYYAWNVRQGFGAEDVQHSQKAELKREVFGPNTRIPGLTREEVNAILHDQETRKQQEDRQPADPKFMARLEAGAVATQAFNEAYADLSNNGPLRQRVQKDIDEFGDGSGNSDLEAFDGCARNATQLVRASQVEDRKGHSYRSSRLADQSAGYQSDAESICRGLAGLPKSHDEHVEQLLPDLLNKWTSLIDSGQVSTRKEARDHLFGPPPPPPTKEELYERAKERLAAKVELIDPAQLNLKLPEETT